MCTPERAYPKVIFKRQEFSWSNLDIDLKEVRRDEVMAEHATHYPCADVAVLCCTASPWLTVNGKDFGRGAGRLTDMGSQLGCVAHLWLEVIKIMILLRHNLQVVDLSLGDL